jgi:hypothetical protein
MYVHACVASVTFQDPASVLLTVLPHAHRPGRDGDRGYDGLGVARYVDQVRQIVLPQILKSQWYIYCMKSLESGLLRNGCHGACGDDDEQRGAERAPHLKQESLRPKRLRHGL